MKLATFATLKFVYDIGSGDCSPVSTKNLVLVSIKFSVSLYKKDLAFSTEVLHSLNCTANMTKVEQKFAKSS